MPEIIELIVRPNPKRYGPYSVYLGETLVCTTRLPLFDGARALLSLGYAPEEMLTMRHQGSSHPSFNPMSIGKAAKLTIIENERQGPTLAPYEPYPLKEERIREKASARRSQSEHQGSPASGNGTPFGTSPA